MVRVPVEWWPRSRFAGRSVKMWFAGERGPVRIPIPDHIIVCDLCNAGIELDPVPVIAGNALCAECCVRVFGFDPNKERPTVVEYEEG